MTTSQRDQAAQPSTEEERAALSMIGSLAPGLLLTFGIAALAMTIQRLSGIPALSPLVVAMILGMGLRNTIGPVAVSAPGVAFSLRRILRGAIVLLGLQLTLVQIASIHGRGILVVIATLGLTFLFTKATGRVLGVERRLSELIAAGTSVCGASAVIATNTVTRGSDEDVAYAIACVTVFGSLSMVLFPLAGTAMQMAPESFGLWSGAAIHEVAQAVASAYQGGDIAGQTGTVAKLGRVVLLAPLILTLGIASAWRGDTGEGRAPTPWFVFGFGLMVLANSLLPLPTILHDAVVAATAFLLTVALAAMGLETDFGKLRAKGARPLLLGMAAWLFISGLALGLTLLLL